MPNANRYLNSFTDPDQTEAPKAIIMFKPIAAPPIIIATVFLCFGAAWITTTDNLLAHYAAGDEQMLLTLSKVKGTAFVVAAALLLYCTARYFHKRYTRTIHDSSQQAMRYQGLYHNIEDGVMEFDYATDTCKLNPYLQDQLNLPETVHDATAYFTHCIHPEDRERVIRTIQMYGNQPGVPWRLSYRYLWPDGNYRKVLNRGYNIAHPQTGITERSVVIVQEIDRKGSPNADLVQQEVHAQKNINLKIMQAQEAERNRLAMELHDNIGQMVAVARLYAEHLGAVNPSPIATKIHTVLSDAVQDIRNLSATMKAPEFDEVSLEDALHMLCGKVMQAKALEISIQAAPYFKQNMTGEQQLMVYRIIQEQLNNIIKHAAASNVAIYLDRSGNEATVKICDDGRGFNPSDRSAGIGLSNMRSRLSLFEGTLEVQSGTGAGCTLIANFLVQ